MALSRRLFAAIDSSGGQPFVTLLSYVPGQTLGGESFTRPSSAAQKDSGGVWQTVGVDVKRDGHYIGGVRTTLLEAAATNHFLNSAAPVTQTSASLATGTYTLWMEGTGSVAVAATTATITGAGTASNGVSVTFVVTVTGTVTYTVTGTPTRVQAENTGTPSSYIATAGAAVTRSLDTYALPVPAFQLSTYYIKLVDLSAAASRRFFGVNNPSNTALRPIMTLTHAADNTVSSLFANGSNSISTTAAVASVYGDTLEGAIRISQNGSSLAEASLNAAASVTGAQGAVPITFPTAWPTGAVLSLAQLTGATYMNCAVLSVKVATSTLTLAQMRAL